MSGMEAEIQGFSISRAWRDKRLRSIIVQILVLAGLFAFFAYIVNNAIANLAALDKSFGFEFLAEPASYDINQRLIEYTSRDSHLRAAVVGILNTGLVAILGIVAATILGFIFGVLRLSNNFLISRIVGVYIELTRNVPVLLQIIMWHAIIVSTMPKPKQAYNFGDIAFLSNRGLQVPDPTFGPAIWAVVAAFVIGLVFTIWFSGYAHKVQDETGKHLPVVWVGFGAIVGLPVLVFLVTGMPVTFEYPVLKGFNFKGGVPIRPELFALWFALSIYTASFIAENVRSGIQAVSHGQTEAAFALGLRPNWTMRLVILPQALRVIIPPLASQYLNLTKNSSLAIAIGYMDIVATLGGITLNQSGKEMECMILVLLIYLSFSITISMFMNWYNKKMALVER